MKIGGNDRHDEFFIQRHNHGLGQFLAGDMGQAGDALGRIRG